MGNNKSKQLEKATLEGLEAAHKRGSEEFIAYVETHSLGEVWEQLEVADTDGVEIAALQEWEANERKGDARTFVARWRQDWQATEKQREVAGQKIHAGQEPHDSAGAARIERAGVSRVEGTERVIRQVATRVKGMQTEDGRKRLRAAFVAAPKELGRKAGMGD